jgi:hypothetical protein
MIPIMPDYAKSDRVHVHSIRLLSGEEALIARVVSKSGKTGYGFSLRLEATEARHMSEWHAGLRPEPPDEVPAGEHPWSKAWAARSPIDWKLEPAFASISWLTA